MTTIEAAADFRGIRKLPFCYLCGRTFTAESSANRDHVPPARLFAEADRQLDPLILPTCESCNNRQSEADEIMIDLVSITRRTDRDRDRLRKQLVYVRDVEDGQRLGVRGVDLPSHIWRWVRAFHAALYAEFLPNIPQRRVFPPLPSGSIETKEVQPTSIDELQLMIVDAVRTNRATKSFDQILCYGGRCEYNCTWEQADDGRMLSMFGLRLYDWEDLGDSKLGPQRSCVGVHVPPSGRPPSGTRATRLEVPGVRRSPLNPFAD